jgi:hypothetical protein
MTASADWDLQVAIYNALTADAGLTALVGPRVYDYVPQGETYPLVVIGDGANTDSPTFGKGGREMRPEIEAWSEDAETTTGNSGTSGYDQAKAVAAAVNAVMMSATLTVPNAFATVIRLESEVDERIALSETLLCRRIKQTYVVLFEDS